MPTDAPAFEDRAVSVWSKRKQLDREVQRALLSASQDLTVCCLTALARLSRLRKPTCPVARAPDEGLRLRRRPVDIAFLDPDAQALSILVPKVA